MDSYPELLAELNLAQSNMENAKARLKAENEHAEAEILEARLRLKNVETLKPFEIQAKQARLDLLVTRLAYAKRDLERMDALNKKKGGQRPKLRSPKRASRIA